MPTIRLSRARPSSTEAVGATPEAAPTPCAPPPDAKRPHAELITPAEAADLLSVTAKVLERWRGTGDGPAFVRLTSKTIRYRREDIGTFVAGRTRASTAGT